MLLRHMSSEDVVQQRGGERAPLSGLSTAQALIATIKERTNSARTTARNTPRPSPHPTPTVLFAASR